MSSLYKVWDAGRKNKKIVVAQTVEELILKSKAKLGLQMERSDLRVVLEKDGSEVDDDELLQFITKDDVLLLMIATDCWSPVETVVNIITEPMSNTEAGTTLFTNNLSQKIRRIRWDNKRKSQPVGRTCAEIVTSPKRFRLQKVDYVDAEDAEPDMYDKQITEISAEFGRKDPNITHVKTLLKATFRQRRTWISALPGDNVSTILETFPCFRHPEFEGDMLPILHFLEAETSFKHGKGQKTKSVVEALVIGETDDVGKALTSRVDSPPRLAAVKNTDKIVNFAILADCESILLKTTNLAEALTELVSFYYASDLDYPRCYSQVLGFLQQVAMQQPYDGKKTNGFIQLLKKVNID